MKMYAILGALGLVIASFSPVSAANSMAGGSMAMGGAMAKCSANDPAVIVNTTKMTFMMDTKPNRTAMSGMMAHDKFVCKSTATKMGAKMKGSSMMMHGKM